MNATQRIRLGLLLTNLKLGGRFSFRTFVNDKDYPKDPDPKNWRTINGSHVHLSNGKIDGGAGEKFKGNEWSGKVKHGNNSFFPPKGWVKPPPPPKKPEPEPVPFGSEELAPLKPAANGVPVAYINTLKGNFKKLSSSEQEAVKDMIKEWKKDGVSKGEMDDIFYPEHHETIQKTIEALKAKQITPLAAQNIIATAMANPGHPGLKKVSEQWGEAAPAAKPPAAKSATTTSEKQAYEKEAEKILKDIDDNPFEAQEMLYKKGFSDEEAEEIVNAYYDEPEAVTTSKIIEALKNNNISVGNKKTKAPKLTKSKKGFASLPAATQKARKAEFEKAYNSPKTVWFGTGTESQQKKVAQTYFDPIVSKWHASMTPEEKSGVVDYTGSSYDPMNDFLRGKVKKPSPGTLQKIKNADSALAKTKPNKETLRLRRGVGNSVFELIKNAPDGVFIDQGYTSTSPCKEGGFGGHEVEIIVPKGVGKGAWVNDISQHKNELEYLLPRGAKFQVCNIEEKSGKKKAQLILLGFEPRKIN